ncbi:hypothetical protein TgHK011_004859 [Trichoderma gracile]|nr:hypothetical protein TgHK011_004859 [Trichoderma gracile]
MRCYEQDITPRSPVGPRLNERRGDWTAAALVPALVLPWVLPMTATERGSGQSRLSCRCLAKSSSSRRHGCRVAWASRHVRRASRHHNSLISCSTIITALLVAGSLAVPAGSYPPPSPTYGDDPSGEVGYPPEYPPDYSSQYPEYPPGHGGKDDGPDDGDEDGYAPPSTTVSPSYPISGGGDKYSYPPPSTTAYPPPPAEGDGDNNGGDNNGGNTGDDGDNTGDDGDNTGDDGDNTGEDGDNNGDDDGDDGDNVPGAPEQPPTDGDSDSPDDGDDGDDTVGGGDDGDGEDTDSDLCPGFLYASPQCCDTSVLGLLDLSCEPPRSTPTDVEAFNDICQEVGQKAQCCVLPVAGQALLCEDVPDA